MEDTIQRRFLAIVRKRPDHPCIIHGDRVYTFKETNERINALAHAFREMGLKKGDRVAAGLYNCPQLIETWFAAFKLGAVAVNLNYRLSPDEMQHVLDDSGSSILVMDQDLVENIGAIRDRLPQLRNCVIVGGPGEPDMPEFESLLAGRPKGEPQLEFSINATDLCQLFYTGGTTGVPKGVMHTHQSNLAITDAFSVNGILMGAVRAIADAEGYKQAIDTWLGVLLSLPKFKPPHFVVSMLAGMLKAEPTRKLLGTRVVQNTMRRSLFWMWRRPPMMIRVMPMRHLIASPIIHGVAWWGGGLICPVTGFTLVLLSSKHFNPVEAMEMIQKHHVNLLGLVGDKFSRMILDVPDLDSYDSSSLIMVGSSGAHWTAQVKGDLHKHFPQAMFIDHLGSTESPAVSTGVYFQGDEYSKLGPGDVEMRVVDEDGREVAPGETGTILVKAGSSGLGYYRDEDKSKETWLPSGWVSTGDSGMMDEMGRVTVFGRGSEVITSGGVKIWAEEVETTIGRHPAVYDVVVFGVPDPEWGESVMAAVVLKEGRSATEEDIAGFCKENLSSFKKPRYVNFVEELPEMPFGKIRRGVVKEMFKEYLAERGSL
jgi:fatty-acyl-CoA synthase